MRSFAGAGFGVYGIMADMGGAFGIAAGTLGGALMVEGIGKGEKFGGGGQAVDFGGGDDATTN